MNRIATIVTTWAAAVLTTVAVLAQQPPPPTGAPGAPGARGGLQQRDPNRCSAPGGFGAASYVSPEPLPDGRVTFRLCAPDATTVSLGSSDNDDIAPNSFMGGSGRAMSKDSKGLWSVTTEKALAPDTYRYFFYVNGVRQPDPGGARVLAGAVEHRLAGRGERTGGRLPDVPPEHPARTGREDRLLVRAARGDAPHARLHAARIREGQEGLSGVLPRARRRRQRSTAGRRSAAPTTSWTT